MLGRRRDVCMGLPFVRVLRTLLATLNPTPRNQPRGER
jgi:hypothetical protein